MLFQKGFKRLLDHIKERSGWEDWGAANKLNRDVYAIIQIKFLRRLLRRPNKCPVCE